MSKIAKALEKAKATQGMSPLQEEVHHGHTSSRLSRGEEASTAGFSTPHPQYSMTRVRKLNNATLEQNRILTPDSSQAVKDAYDLLRTQILHRTKEKGWNTLMVTSAVSGEGKTITALNLALSMARQADQTALLVDANLRSPAVTGYLGLESESMGLSDYLLQDDVIVPDLLINPDVEKFVVLPAGRPLSGSTDVLGTPRMRHLVGDLKNRYPDRYVIYDCPHILSMPDSLVFASYVDAILVVVEANSTSRHHIESAMKQLEGRNIVGTVINKIEIAA
ncbi:AAA family ATPase [Desulfovibrio inopinatus]|uniref:AAA family ATPase n=1 Tax=Desulfovibrio inopinatus TaxID=102109 RepID=UPI00040DE8AD|nr:AAA family ATPase [Desulfovibrio inopinatus]